MLFAIAFAPFPTPAPDPTSGWVLGHLYAMIIGVGVLVGEALGCTRSDKKSDKIRQENPTNLAISATELKARNATSATKFGR